MSQRISVRPVLVPLLPYMVKGYDVETKEPVMGFPYVLAREAKRGIETLNCVLDFSLEDSLLPEDVAKDYALCIPDGEFHVVKHFYKFLYLSPDGIAHFEDENDSASWN